MLFLPRQSSRRRTDVNASHAYSKFWPSLNVLPGTCNAAVEAEV